MKRAPQTHSSPSLRQLTKGWSLLLQTAIWFLGTVGSFLLPPPVGISREEDKVWLRLAQFVMAALLGIMFIAAQRWYRKNQLRWWWLLSTALLVFSILGFIWYEYLSYSWT